MNLEKIGFIALVVIGTLIVWHYIAPTTAKQYTGTV
jgi:hypothetical protein